MLTDLVLDNYTPRLPNTVQKLYSSDYVGFCTHHLNGMSLYSGLLLYFYFKHSYNIFNDERYNVKRRCFEF